MNKNIGAFVISIAFILILVKEYWYILGMLAIGCIIIYFYKHRTSGYSKYGMAHVDSMSGEEFETYLHQLYRSLGYKVKSTPRSGDYGADLILFKNGVRSCLQAKRYNGNVGVAAIQEVIGSLAHYNATQGIVVTNRYYTQNAKRLALENNITLVDRDSLWRMQNRALKSNKLWKTG